MTAVQIYETMSCVLLAVEICRLYRQSDFYLDKTYALRCWHRHNYHFAVVCIYEQIMDFLLSNVHNETVKVLSILCVGVCILCFTLCAGESLVFLSCVHPVFYIVCW